MASRVQVAKSKFPLALHDFNDLERTRIKPSLSREWNMDEDDVIDQLHEDSFNTRVEILEQLLITVKRNGGRLPYNDQLSIFQGLAQALTAEHWEIRLKCIQLINEIIPNFGEGLDTCMAVVMKKLLPNIGDIKISVRRAVIQTLHVYMKNVNNVNIFLHNIVHIGLDNDNAKVRRETINALPVLLTREFSNVDLYEVTQSLAKKLIDSSVEDNLRDPSLFTMKKIEELVGEREFNTYLQRLAVPIRRYYLQLTDRQEKIKPNNQEEFHYSAPTSSRDRHTPFVADSLEMNGYHQGSVSNGGSGSSATYMDSYEFGIIPSHVMNDLNNQDNFRVRAQAVEELKGIMIGLSSNEVAQTLLPHMIAFISFLNNLLDDPNFKITTVTLEILSLLVEKSGSNVKLFLKPFVLAMAKRMGDTKIVVRQAVMRVAMKMMQSYSPRPVLSVICENLNHRNSRVRQETINIVIAALMTFPSYDFVLSDICEVVGPSLTDSKRQVRQAALECFAALAQAMGAGRLQPLVQAVDSVELNTEREGEGLMAAVQARLARRQLPRLNADGLVEYATPIPSSATHRQPANQSQGADMEWILAVGSGNGSARSTRTESMEIESVSSSARTTPHTSEQKPNPRRYMSAGKGRNRLPWEDEERNRRGYDSVPTSASHVHEDPGPPRTKLMWTSDNESTPDLRRVPKRRQTVVGIRPADEQDNVSYTQLYKNRLKKNQQLSNANSRPSHLDILDTAPSSNTRNIRENGSVRNDYKSPRPFLDPITVDNINNEDKQDVDESPVHIRPTLARGSANSSRRISPKVPPTYQPERYTTNTYLEDDSDSAYAPSLEGTLEYDQDQEMVSSLRGIRNSASKKKNQKKEELQKKSSQQSLNSSPSLSDTLDFESGVYSSRTDLNSRKKAESPFESKPKLVRSGVNFSKKNSSDSLGDDGEYKNGSYPNHVEFNPASGVTFPTNRSSDVQIVGKGYSDDSSNEIKISPTHKSKERKRIKGTHFSPLGMASMHSTGAADLHDDKIPRQQKITMIGKGVFDSSVNGNEITNTSYQLSPENRPNRNDVKIVPKGVYGIGVKNSPSESNSYSSLNSLSDEENLLDESSVPGSNMTKANIDHIKQKQIQLRQEELEQKRLEKEEKIRKEKERQQEKLRRLSSSENFGIETLSINGSSSSPNPTKTSPPKPLPPAITPKKIKTENKPVSSSPMSAQYPPPNDSDNPEDWKPVRDPDAVLKDALKKLSQDDWDVKCDGINKIRQLSLHHSDVIQAQLHTVTVAINAEVKNLRSQVSRLAICCLGELFANLKRGMDPDLDSTTRTLLAKNAESNGFIKQDVEKALENMIDNVSPPRALTALILGGAGHKSNPVRKMTAQFLVELTEKMGPGRILSGIKDITDKILPTAAKFIQDGSPETRYYGRKILYTLMSHQDFEKMLNKHVNSTTIRNIQETLDSLKQKGLGDMPNETPSAKSRRSGHGSRSNSTVRGNSANSANGNNNTPLPKRRTVKTDAATLDEINQMINMMSASNWNDRYNALKDFLVLCEANPDHIAPHIVKIFDKFSPRLVDSNSKVNLFALQVMFQVIPLLKDSLPQGPVLNIAIGNVVPNLSSKNRDIHEAAAQILEALIEHIDACQLIEPFANQTIAAGPRSKPEIVEKVAYLVQKVYVKKQKLVILRVLPLLWHLLVASNSSGAVHGGSGDLRTASAQLANVLYSNMGTSLIDKAQADPNITPRHVEFLNQLLDR